MLPLGVFVGTVRALAAALHRRAAEFPSSDLFRARPAVEVIASFLDSAMTLCPNLREKSFGEAEGRVRVWLRERRIRGGMGASSA